MTKLQGINNIQISLWINETSNIFKSFV